MQKLKFLFIIVASIFLITSCGDEECADGYCADSIPGKPFVTVWKTDNEGISKDNQVIITVDSKNYTYNYNIDCDSDGILEAKNLTGDYTCNYDTPGTYTISISGEYPRFYIYGLSTKTDKLKLIRLKQWGTQKWKTARAMFSAFKNLVIDAVDEPDFSEVTDMSYMFANANSFNTDISHWDVSKITDMEYMFFLNKSFNQDLSSWDVSNVTNCRTFNAGTDDSWTLPKPNFTKCTIRTE